ncbi:uncharacterized protein LOC128546328 [Mercenaria mercenaria]|uniref:uncharacterized protein LOC128546328 n=1 Tax=Mercenaria mercenaria TaxID=6596 RepID=UPI00234F3971|nr:uncharacterized protein LOC128546328 [Mercenaria mercenaria]
MDDLEYVERLGDGNSNCNAEGVTTKTPKKKSEKQKERVRQYKKKMRKIKRKQEQLLNEMNMCVDQVHSAVPDTLYISDSKATSAMDGVLSSASLPSPALGILSPKKDISLRGFKSIFESALAMQYIERVSTLRATADVFEPTFRMIHWPKKSRAMHLTEPVADMSHAKKVSASELHVPAVVTQSGSVSKLQANVMDVSLPYDTQLSYFPKQEVPVSTLNASAKPFVPAALRKAKKVFEGQSALGSSVVAIAGNQKQETASTSRSDAVLATQEAVSTPAASSSTFVPSGENYSDIPATGHKVSYSTRFNVKTPKDTPYVITDDDEVFGILDVYAGSCLHSDITVTSSIKTEEGCGYSYFTLSNL